MLTDPLFLNIRAMNSGIVISEIAAFSSKAQKLSNSLNGALNNPCLTLTPN